jgi:hypothetical protein
VGFRGGESRRRSREAPVPESRELQFHRRLRLRQTQEPQHSPSELCDDATFLRRVCLDTIGLLPTADEARRFLADQDSQKREKLVAALLDRPEYAEFWSQYWGDRLLNSKELLYQYGPQNFTRWLYQAFRTNMPYDQFVPALLTASGDMYDPSRPTSYYPLHQDARRDGGGHQPAFLGRAHRVRALP